MINLNKLTQDLKIENIDTVVAGWGWWRWNCGGSSSSSTTTTTTSCSSTSSMSSSSYCGGGNPPGDE